MRLNHTPPPKINSCCENVQARFIGASVQRPYECSRDSEGGQHLPAHETAFRRQICVNTQYWLLPSRASQPSPIASRRLLIAGARIQLASRMRRLRSIPSPADLSTEPVRRTRPSRPNKMRNGNPRHSLGHCRRHQRVAPVPSVSERRERTRTVINSCPFPRAGSLNRASKVCRLDRQDMARSHADFSLAQVRQTCCPQPKRLPKNRSIAVH